MVPLGSLPTVRSNSSYVDVFVGKGQRNTIFILKWMCFASKFLDNNLSTYGYLLITITS